MHLELRDPVLIHYTDNLMVEENVLFLSWASFLPAESYLGVPSPGEWMVNKHINELTWGLKGILDQYPLTDKINIYYMLIGYPHSFLKGEFLSVLEISALKFKKVRWGKRKNKLLKIPGERLPDGPVVKTPCSPCRGPGVQSLVRKLDPEATTKTQRSKKQKQQQHSQRHLCCFCFEMHSPIWRASLEVQW